MKKNLAYLVQTIALILLMTATFSRSTRAAEVVLQDGKLMVATPEDQEAKPTSGNIQIPARSAAVILEQ